MKQCTIYKQQGYRSQKKKIDSFEKKKSVYQDEQGNKTVNFSRL